MLPMTRIIKVIILLCGGSAMSSLKNELHARHLRKISKDDKSGIIGVEIKNRRKNKEQTLEKLSDNICSLSYLCKIEKNQIEPNKAFLREICSRLELSDDKVDFLFKLKEVLSGIVRAYLTGDYSYIEYAYETGKGLDNYRFTIIKFAYLISKKKISEANKIYYDLLQILSNFSDYDLTIFALFSSILLILKFEFKEALSNMEYIDPSSSTKEACLLKSIIEFKLHFSMNMADTPMYYEEAKKLSFEFGYFSIIESLNYYLALYYIKNKCDYSFNTIISKINNTKLSNSLKCIKAFLENNISVLLNADKNLNEFASILKLLCVNFDDAVIKIKDNSVDYYRDDYDQLFLDYLSLNKISERHKFIFDKGLTLAIKFNDSFLCNYFLDELSILSKSSKYRSLAQGYAMVHDEFFNMAEFEVMKYEK